MGHRHFTLMVVGDNHEEIVKKYDRNNKVKPYVVAEFKKANEYKKKTIDMYKEALGFEGMSDEKKEVINERISYYESLSDLDFFLEMTENYEIDEKTGDAYSYNNPDGKYNGCAIGGNFALPLKTLNGEETYSEVKSNINWSEIHLKDDHLYAFAWDSVMGDRKPETDDEKIVYENMKNRKEYFRTYGTRENYIASNTSFWCYAFLSEETGWIELDKNTEQFEWVKSFKERFVDVLPDDARITIYECTRF